MEHTYFIRPLKNTDADRMLEWMQNEKVTRYLNIGGSTTTLASVLKFISEAKDESINVHRAVVDENDRYCGTVSLKNIDREKHEAEYAIALHEDAHGTGAAMAATEQIAKFAVEKMDLQRLYLCVRPENMRAIGFYKKCGWMPCSTVGEETSKMLWFERPTV